MEENNELNKIFLENFNNKKLSTECLISFNLNSKGKFQIDENIINYDKGHSISKSLMDFVIL